MKTTIVIPTYNEAENLPRLIPVLFSLPLDLHALIVDDSSPDGTGRLADEIAEKYPKAVQVLHRPGKLGLRSAYLNGFQKVLNEGSDIVVQMDADFSHDPKLLPEMVKRLDGCDLVLGSRYIPGGGVDQHWAVWRKGLSAFGNIYARSILGIPLHDVTTGFRLWRSKTLLQMPLERIRSSGYLFQVEMAYLAYCLEFRIEEFPIYFPDRQMGNSKMSLRIQIEAALRIWQVWWNFRELRLAGRNARL